MGVDGVADKKPNILEKIAEKEKRMKEGHFYADSSLDIVFMIDTTGSMDPYIDEVKHINQSIIE